MDGDAAVLLFVVGRAVALLFLGFCTESPDWPLRLAEAPWEWLTDSFFVVDFEGFEDGFWEVFDRAAGCRLTEALVGRILTERITKYA